MRDGRIEQNGAPRAVYEQPESRFVADFIGTSNFIDGTVERRDGDAHMVRTEDGVLRVHSDTHYEPGDAVVVAARPEHIELGTSLNGVDANVWRGRVEARAFLGEVVDHVVSVGSREIRARCNSKVSIPAPTEVTVRFHDEAFSLVPAGD